MSRQVTMLLASLMAGFSLAAALLHSPGEPEVTEAPKPLSKDHPDYCAEEALLFLRSNPTASEWTCSLSPDFVGIPWTQERVVPGKVYRQISRDGGMTWAAE